MKRITTRNRSLRPLTTAAIVLAVVGVWSSCRPREEDREPALRLQIADATRAARSSLEKRFRAIEPIRVTLPGSESSIPAYDGDEVIAASSIGQTELVQGLKATELLALKEYVTLAYPLPTREVLEKITRERGEVIKEGLKDGPSQDSSPLTRPEALKKNTDEPKRLIISEDLKSDVFASASRFISQVRRLSEEGRLSIDLTVNSNPDRATYDMWPSGGPHRTTTTKNTIDNIYRGIYRYQITKPGYKPIEGMLNLVDSNGRTLECGLNKTEEQDGPYPCQLQN